MLGGNIEERMHMETVDCEINNYPCAYAQQGYVFGRVGLYVYLFIYIYMYVNKKKTDSTRKYPTECILLLSH